MNRRLLLAVAVIVVVLGLLVAAGLRLGPGLAETPIDGVEGLVTALIVGEDTEYAPGARVGSQ